MADSSYLLRKTHCLMLLSFVSRQCCLLINLQSLPPQKRALGMFLFGRATTSHPANHQGLTQALVTVLCTWAVLLLATAGCAARSSTGTECQGTL